MAATKRKKKRRKGSNTPVAAMAPAAKRRESPGRKGVTIRPVPVKMIRKRIA